MGTRRSRRRVVQAPRSGEAAASEGGAPPAAEPSREGDPAAGSAQASDVAAQRAAAAEQRADAAEQRAALLSWQLAEARSRIAELEGGRKAGDERGGRAARARKARFERHEGSDHPLRLVYPDGSWLGVNRDHKGLFSCDARGRILQILPPERFHAPSPRRFQKAYEATLGEPLGDRIERDAPPKGKRDAG